MSGHICIYSKKRFDDTTLNSGDHIILSSIGGKQKLPKSYVSHEVNNGFSNLEGIFIKKSIYAMPRQFNGPGKRGSMAESKASKQICILGLDSPDRMGLGYIKMGKPYYIHQFIVESPLIKGSNPVQVSLNSEETMGIGQKEYVKLTDKFLEKFKKHKDLSLHILLIECEIPSGKFMFGEMDDKFYLAVHSEHEIKAALDSLELMQKRDLTNRTEGKSIVSDGIKANQTLEFNDDIKRIIGKMAFNFLAFKKGPEFILDDKFDGIRRWIYKGDIKNQYVSENISEINLKENLGNRADIHYIVIEYINSKLIAKVNIYGIMEYIVDFSPYYDWNMKEKEQFEIICDFKNGREYYSLTEYSEGLIKQNLNK